MVFRTLVYQVTVAAYVSDIVTIIIAAPYPLFFHNLELLARGEECSRELCPSKYNNEIDL